MKESFDQKYNINIQASRACQANTTNFSGDFSRNYFFATVQNEASCQQNVGLDWVVKATPTLSLHSKSLSDLLITKVGAPCRKQAISSTITGRNPDRGAGEAISRAYPRVIDSWK